MKDLQVYILRQILPVFRPGNHLENDLGHQVFGISDNDSKCLRIPAQNPVNQLFIFRIISHVIIHVVNQTGKLQLCCKKIQRKSKITGYSA